MEHTNLLVIGGGIVGLATAYSYLKRHSTKRIVVLEKEPEVALHQTGRNSGVIHSGVYYTPGSLKAKNCRAGKKLLELFCDEHRIPYETCGKLIVASHEGELPSLIKIFDRGQQNGVRCELVDRKFIQQREPAVSAIKALYVPEAGIVDYREVSKQLARCIEDQGSTVQCSSRVVSATRSDSGMCVETQERHYHADFVVNCAGLHSDRVGKMLGQKVSTKIVPFRGEYFFLSESAKKFCRHLIYPVPDLRFPFLGVHFTRMIDGSVECGPNAVLAFAREGYSKTDFSLQDMTESVLFPGFFRFASTHISRGLLEFYRSLSKAAFVRALQVLIPDIRSHDIASAPAGVRAQAMDTRGRLLDDFVFEQGDRVLSVINAPSPAATSALSIGQTVADMIP